MPVRPPTHGQLARADQPVQPRADNRPSAAKRGYGRHWQRFAAAFLMEHPLCVECEAEGDLVPATQVDHIIAHRGDMELFWRIGNHQGLCDIHHSRKTVRECSARGEKSGVFEPKSGRF